MPTLACADARHLPLPDQYVQCVITSPPYWAQRDYEVPGQIGLEATPHDYVKHLAQVGAEIWRVLKDDGTFWLNIADTIFGDSPVRRSAREAFSTTWDATQTRSRGGTRRSAASSDGVKLKSLVGIPYLLIRELQQQGWRLRSEVIWAKPKAKTEGRARDRLMRTHESLFLLVKSRHYYFDFDALPLEYRSDVWTIPVSRYDGAHFATFPPALIEPCLLAGSTHWQVDHPRSVVLDPFCGSGTVGVVAQQHGRYFIGLDLKPAYLELSRKRIADATAR